MNHKEKIFDEGATGGTCQWGQGPPSREEALSRGEAAPLLGRQERREQEALRPSRGATNKGRRNMKINLTFSIIV